MYHPDDDISSLLDYMNKFAALQVFATLCLATATTLFALHDYLMGLGSGLLGIIAYVVYEVLPDNK